ncbi:MAG TPA: RNA polymerase sigma factor [Opitutaceae bacterium]
MARTDEAAADEFDQLVDAHYKPLFRFAMSLSGSEARAADLVQQTFYTWAAKGHQLRDRSRAKSWLFTTLHREFLQTLRRESRMVLLADVDDELAGPSEPAPEPEVIEGIETGEIYAALAEVPEVFRVPLTLFYLEEFTYAGIAEVLEVPIGTVMSRLSRGKEKLRKRLKQRSIGADGRLLPFTPGEKGVQHGE